MNAFKLVLALIIGASLATSIACGEKETEETGTTEAAE